MGMPKQLPSMGRDVLHRLLQHCGSCAVPWWKVSEISLQVLWGSLMAYTWQLPLASAKPSQLCPITRDAWVWMFMSCVDVTCPKEEQQKCHNWADDSWQHHPFSGGSASYLAQSPACSLQGCVFIPCLMWSRGFNTTSPKPLPIHPGRGGKNVNLTSANKSVAVAPPARPSQSWCSSTAFLADTLFFPSLVYFSLGLR